MTEFDVEVVFEVALKAVKDAGEVHFIIQFLILWDETELCLQTLLLSIDYQRSFL